MLGAPALGSVLEAFTLVIDVEPSGTLKLIADAVAQMHGGEMLLFAVGITVGPALGEELMFRGYIQPRLIARYGATAGIAIASALFGLLHMDALQSPLAGILGLYIGLVAYHMGSLWPAILTHAFNNLLSVATLYFFPDAQRDTQAGLITGVIGLVVFIYCLRHVLLMSVHRKNGRPPDPFPQG
jgi:membrane protease YdiL (CAAX protease family)